MSPEEYRDFIRSATLADGNVDPPISLIVVHNPTEAIQSPASLPVIVCALGSTFGGPGPDGADLVVAADDLDDLRRTVQAAPVAAMTLALHLRAIEGLEPELALVVESAAYSTTQSGNEFSAWRAAARHATDSSTAPRVRATREGNRLQVLLDRPERHNAIDARMRDELCEALAIAVADQSIEHVEISGAGPSFCSGGDLGEFGTRSNPAEAHVIRLTHSPGRAILRVAARTTVRIHGATVGGGIEMAAFAGQVIAHPDSKIGLPEIGLGLIPGAGGTVSIPRRIGRQRTAALALTGRILSAHEALEWGLVDEVC